MRTVKEMIGKISEPQHTKVHFRFEGKGDSIFMDIGEFLKEYGHYNVGLNGEFLDGFGNYIYNSFIKRTL